MADASISPSEYWDVGWEGYQTSAEPAEEFSVQIAATVRAGSSVGNVVARGSGEEAIKRWLSCLLVTAIPSMGISEALDELTHLHRFYTEQNSIEKSRTSEPRPLRVPVKLRASEKSPSISFDK